METDDPRSVLEALATRHGESLAGLSRMLGRNDAYLQQFVKRGSPRQLAEQDRRQLADYFRIDEAMLGAPTDRRSPAPTPRVPRLDVAAAAGAGAVVADETALYGQMFDPALLASLGVRVENLSVVTATGESMLPTIMPDDDLLVDRSDTHVSQRGALFVLRVGDLVLVKRVARLGNRLVITSDNPDYPGVPPTGVEIVGRVVWLSRALR